MDKRSFEFSEWLANFLNFAIEKENFIEKNRCLYLKCGNKNKLNVNEIQNHVFENGIDKSYKNWIWHGEEIRSIMNAHAQPLPQRESTMMMLFLTP